MISPSSLREHRAERWEPAFSYNDAKPWGERQRILASMMVRGLCNQSHFAKSAKGSIAASMKRVAALIH
jgi:hypothetical protein